MTSKAKKKFRNAAGHVVETSLPVEQVRLRGSGYREVAAPEPATADDGPGPAPDAGPVPAPVPDAKPAKPAKK